MILQPMCGLLPRVSLVGLALELALRRCLAGVRCTGVLPLSLIMHRGVSMTRIYCRCIVGGRRLPGFQSRWLHSWRSAMVVIRCWRRADVSSCRWLGRAVPR